MRRSHILTCIVSCVYPEERIRSIFPPGKKIARAFDLHVKGEPVKTSLVLCVSSARDLGFPKS